MVNRLAKKLIDKLASLYNFVIYDIIHFLENSDVKSMAAKIDGTVMIVQINKTPVS